MMVEFVTENGTESLSDVVRVVQQGPGRYTVLFETEDTRVIGNTASLTEVHAEDGSCSVLMLHQSGSGECTHVQRATEHGDSPQTCTVAYADGDEERYEDAAIVAAAGTEQLPPEGELAIE